MTTENNENELNKETIDSMAEKKDSKPKKRWYVVHTYSGYENKVKTNLEKRIEYMNMGEKIFRVEVPQKPVTKIKDGKKTEREEKIYPGYVLVEMILDEDSWYVVRHTAGVTKFISAGAKENSKRLKPIPVKESEIKKILYKTQTTVAKVELDVKVGDKVKIISGPFSDFDGIITEVYPDKAKLRATVSIFGRETPVELEYKQIEKV
jgi:transcriptional antiterminator NusG